MSILLLQFQIVTVGYTGISFEFSKGRKIPRFPVSIKLDNGESYTAKTMFDTGALATLIVSVPFKNHHNFEHKLGKIVKSTGSRLNAITHDEEALLKSLNFNGFTFGRIVIDLA